MTYPSWGTGVPEPSVAFLLDGSVEFLDLWEMLIKNGNSWLLRTSFDGEDAGISVTLGWCWAWWNRVFFPMGSSLSSWVRNECLWCRVNIQNIASCSIPMGTLWHSPHTTIIRVLSSLTGYTPDYLFLEPQKISLQKGDYIEKECLNGSIEQMFWKLLRIHWVWGIIVFPL